MKKNRRLVLHRETIAALQRQEMKRVAGKAGNTGPDCDSIEPWWSCTCPSPLDQ
jgi:natural product precursor